jgi:hypothetical protein
MIRIALKSKHNKEIKELSIPQNASECTLRQFVNAQIGLRELDSFLQKEQQKAEAGDLEQDIEKANMDFYLEYARIAMKIVSEFLDETIVDYDLPTGDFHEHVRQVFGGGEVLSESELDTLGVTFLTIFERIIDVVRNYRPNLPEGDRYTFTYQSSSPKIHFTEKYEWFLPRMYKDLVTGQMEFDDIPVGKFVETMQTLKIYNEYKDKDVKGNVMLLKFCNMLSILCRSETFPIQFPYKSQDAIHEYIHNMGPYFMDVPMQVALDVENWFSGFYDSLKKKRADFSSSLIHLHPMVRELTRKQRQASNLATKRSSNKPGITG